MIAFMIMKRSRLAEIAWQFLIQFAEKQLIPERQSTARRAHSLSGEERKGAFDLLSRKKLNDFSLGRNGQPSFSTI
ncbi:MAG: hypothetical protein LUH20_04095 [Lachnospiraceae bacterium]|nr:hypothetical protein [Lachnospiraceae bacterium]